MPRRSDRTLLRALGARVAILRAGRELTQEQLAVLAEVEPLTISRLERGVRALSLANLAAVAAALNLPLAALFSPDPPPDAGDEAWRVLWNQLPTDRRELAIRVVRELARPGPGSPGPLS